MGQVNCRKHYLSLRKSLVLYIIAFVVLAVFLSVTTFSICDCAEGDKPLEIAPCSDRYAPEARNDIACIGIIGGADGPIAIVCGDSSKEKLHAVCSSLHFEPVEGDIEWRIVFNIKNSNEMSLELI